MLDSDPISLTQLSLGETSDGDATVPSSVNSESSRVDPTQIPRTRKPAPPTLPNDPLMSKEDFEMGLVVSKFSVATSTIIMRKPERQARKPQEKVALPIPEPDAITMEYLLMNQTHVRNILKADETKIKDVTRMKHYPNQTGGRIPAIKFVKGLEVNGLGRYSPNSDSFKRFNPHVEECPDREGVKRKWQRLCLE